MDETSVDLLKKAMKNYSISAEEAIKATQLFSNAFWKAHGLLRPEACDNSENPNEKEVLEFFEQNDEKSQKSYFDGKITPLESLN